MANEIWFIFKTQIIINIFGRHLFEQYSMLLQWYPYRRKEIGFQIIQLNPASNLPLSLGIGRAFYDNVQTSLRIHIHAITICISPIISPHPSWHHLITSVILKTILTFCCPRSYWLGNDCLFVQWYHPSNYRSSQHQRSQAPEILMMRNSLVLVRARTWPRLVC